MAAGAFTFYSSNKYLMSFLDLSSETLKIALIDSAYTPVVTVTGDQVWSDVSGSEIAAGNGYSAGGIALTTAAYAAMGTNLGYKFTSDNAVWTASGGDIPAWRYGVMYVSGAFGDVTNPLIGYFLGDATNVDVPPTASGNTLTIACPTNGWFAIT